MSKFLWLFDPGHGGVVAGKYLTEGKRSPKWADGFPQLFEGEFNRAIVRRLMEMCQYAGIDYVNIVPEDDDITLRTRVSRANDLHDAGHKCIYVSIHANAFEDQSVGGFEVWTSKGLTGADVVATTFFNHIKQAFISDEKIKFREQAFEDGDPDREHDDHSKVFYVLKHTKMPAILTENLFMTNPYECKRYLLSKEGRDMIAEAHFRAILEMERG